MKNTPLLFFLFDLLLMVSCHKKQVPAVNYAAEMRAFVGELSGYAKSTVPGFLIVPQNGVALVAADLEDVSTPDISYLAAVDGCGQEDLFFGYDKEDKATKTEDAGPIINFLDVFKENGKQVLVTDYCSSHDNMDESYMNNASKNYISFAAPDRNLTIIPDYPSFPYNENPDDITALSVAKNFLYLIDPEKSYANKEVFIAALAETNYDVLIIDLFFGEEQLSAEDVAQLKTKSNGGERLVLCYMSIGEAEDYRYYWKKEWGHHKTEPSWLYKENKHWRGNYKVFYWQQEWKDIIFGSPGAYLDRIMGSGFSGVYLDIIDAYEYYLDL